MAKLGIVVENYEPYRQPDFEVWPENVDAVQMFIRAATQWRMGPSGPTGLDYTAVFQLMALYDINNKQELFEQLQIMEYAALVKLSERADG